MTLLLGLLKKTRALMLTLIINLFLSRKAMYTQLFYADSFVKICKYCRNYLILEQHIQSKSWWFKTSMAFEPSRIRVIHSSRLLLRKDICESYTLRLRNSCRYIEDTTTKHPRKEYYLYITTDFCIIYPGVGYRIVYLMFIS